jgi:hypothetical protein
MRWLLAPIRSALLREGIENSLSGDVETGKIILRDFINATVGFTKLSGVTHRSAKSLMRMLGPRGNPQARNLFAIVAYLQQAEGVRFEVRPARGALRAKQRPSTRAEQKKNEVKSRTFEKPKGAPPAWGHSASRLSGLFKVRGR